MNLFSQYDSGGLWKTAVYFARSALFHLAPWKQRFVKKELHQGRTFRFLLNRNQDEVRTIATDSYFDPLLFSPQISPA